MQYFEDLCRSQFQIGVYSKREFRTREELGIWCSYVLRRKHIENKYGKRLCYVVCIRKELVWGVVFVTFAVGGYWGESKQRGGGRHSLKGGITVMESVIISVRSIILISEWIILWPCSNWLAGIFWNTIFNLILCGTYHSLKEWIGEFGWDVTINIIRFRWKCRDNAYRWSLCSSWIAQGTLSPGVYGAGWDLSTSQGWFALTRDTGICGFIP